MQAELDFAVDFAKTAGSYMLQRHDEAIASQKLDHSVVTDVELELSQRFVPGVRSQFGPLVAVTNKETPVQEHVDLEGTYWGIDPLDGTGEYVNAKVPREQRTSCIGLYLMRGGEVQLSVVYNPFRKWLFTATHDGASCLNGGVMATMPSGTCSAITPGVAYDYCHWDDCPVDLRPLEKAIGRSRYRYSAISQACDVALGESAFAVFPGNTIHDIAPGALMVERAGGVVSDLQGRPLQWDNLNGAIYACNPVVHREALRIVEVHR